VEKLGARTRIEGNTLHIEGIGYTAVKD